MYRVNRSNLRTSKLSRQVLLDRWQALQRQRLHTGRQLVAELGVDLSVPDEDQHYPPDDFLDSQSGAQYFLHRHDAETLGITTHIHFFKRWSSPKLKDAGLASTTTHLVALELDQNGSPAHWFTVNQWVVGDYWLSADETVKLFDGWGFSSKGLAAAGAWGFWHQWLATLVNVHLHGVIYDLLQQRDIKLDAMLQDQPDLNVLQDRSFEVFDRVVFDGKDALN